MFEVAYNLSRRIQKKLVEAIPTVFFECYGMLFPSLSTWLPHSRGKAVALRCLTSALQQGSWNGAPTSKWFPSVPHRTGPSHPCFGCYTSSLWSKTVLAFLATKSQKPSSAPDKESYRRPPGWSRNLGLAVSRVGKLATIKVTLSLPKQI